MASPVYSVVFDGFGQSLGTLAPGGYKVSLNEPIGFGGQFGCWTEPSTYILQSSAPQYRLFQWVWMGHRMYDPRACRFINRDPIGYDGGVNQYAYCENNPINFVDPSGLDFTLGDPNNPLLVFTWSGTGRGLQTGIAATGHAFSFGLYNGGDFRNDPGFGESTFLAEVGRDLLIEAATAGAGEWIHTARAEKLVAGALNRAKAATPLGRSYGTRLHTALRNEIEALNNKAIEAELSYIRGRVVGYGSKGSIRVDVQINRLLGGGPKKILDLKTGTAKLTPKRISQILSHMRKGFQNIPVKEIR